MKIIILIIFLILGLINLSESQSLCDKYSQLLNTTNLGLVGSLIDGTIARATGNLAPTTIYFNGFQPSNSINYLEPNNSPQYFQLRTNLITYFALPTVLNCTDGTIGTYQGPTNMTSVHFVMGITTSDYNYFTNQVMLSVASLGVSSNDQTTISGIMNSFGTLIISSGISVFPSFLLIFFILSITFIL